MSLLLTHMWLAIVEWQRARTCGLTRPVWPLLTCRWSHPLFCETFLLYQISFRNVSGNPNRNRNLYFLTNMTMNQRARAIRAGWVSSLLTGLPLRTWFQPWHRDRSHQQHTASFSSLGLFGMNCLTSLGRLQMQSGDSKWGQEEEKRGTWSQRSEG